MIKQFCDRCGKWRKLALNFSGQPVDRVSADGEWWNIFGWTLCPSCVLDFEAWTKKGTATS